MSLSLGDMAGHTSLLRHTSSVKKSLTQHTAELSSGQKSDLRSALSGDFGPLGAIDRGLRLVGAYATTIHEAEQVATNTQTSLETISAHVSTLSPALLAAAAMGDNTSLTVNASDANARLGDIVAMINQPISGRALFSGIATDTKPLTDAETLLTDLETALTTAGVTTVTDKLAVLDTWFGAGGGFETQTYQGSTVALSDFALSETSSLNAATQATDPAFRDILKGLAIGALTARGAFGTTTSERAEALKASGETLLGADSSLSQLQARIGIAQERIEDARTANVAQKYALETAKSELISADIYDVSAKLAEAEAQLELIYTLTARLSRLKLSEYI